MNDLSPIDPQNIGLSYNLRMEIKGYKGSKLIIKRSNIDGLGL